MSDVTLLPPAAGGDPGDPDSTTASAAASTDTKADPGTVGQWRMMWRRFRRHRLAMTAAVVLGMIYFVAIFAEFLAPYSPSTRFDDLQYAPPQLIRPVDTSDGFAIGLFAHGYEVTTNEETQRRTVSIDESVTAELGFFVKGEEYELFGLIPWDRHFIGPTDPDNPVFVLGTDRLGRDMLSRLVHGTRVSMSIGLVGVAASMVIGILIGGLSGYYGGAVDTAAQRLIEFIMCIPTLPLWMMLAASVPDDWGVLTKYFAITVILSVIGWTDLARVVRGRFLALREEDFVEAARLDNCGSLRIIRRYLLPSFSSHIIAALTLAIPAMILAETALSFLGLGMQAPAVSWGVLLQEAQNVRSLVSAPWLLIPGIAVVVAVLALNFVGDGLRDAADPYNTGGRRWRKRT
ncbi:ABC transporter permease [Jiangella asiatica]|uniref:ABC transporter permease n=1 Tax=Jiangella asiatica TaxID=2530372 RepID=A0A4R5DEA1_9ACTN|nr:ABC transporter permease [Jiangella asiatica]TDE08633.1 ABC transporter permease [Jiangella asiatica]